MIDLSIKGYKIVAIVLITLRIFVPLIIFLDPFWISIALQLFDAWDYTFIMNAKMMKFKTYQFMDKILDFYYLTVLFVYSIHWNIILLTVLFIWRFIGFIVVLFKTNRAFFLLFPNVFEPMFNLFAFGITKSEGFLKFLNTNLILFLAIVVIIKLFVEYYVHIYNGEALFYKWGVLKKENWAEEERDEGTRHKKLLKYVIKK